MGDSDSQPDEWVIKMEEKLIMTEPLPLKEEYLLPRDQRERLQRFYANDIYGENRGIFRPKRVIIRGSGWGEMEEMKEASLVHFLRRSAIRNPLRSYLKALSEVSDKLKEAWEKLGYPWEFDDTQDFVRTMLLNGAFLLEFMHTKREHSRTSILQSPHAAGSAAPVNVNLVMWRILVNHDETNRYVRDILLFGNQLPIMLLERLLMVEEGTTRIHKDFQINFLKDIATTFIPVNRVPRIEHMYGEFESSLNILDVYRRCLVHRDFKRARRNKQRRKSQEEFYSMNIPSATELHKVGIGFTISGSTSMLDVSLQGKTLMLPEIVVDDSTWPSLFNLITFEQLHKDVAKNEVTSYMYFMGCLVLVANDASLLQSCGIIVTTLPPAEVAKFFNKVTKKCSIGPDGPLATEITNVITMVRARYKKMSIEWRKDLFQTYLKSPWAIMSVVAAILLFTLSIIQTVYTVLSYVRPK